MTTVLLSSPQILIAAALIVPALAALIIPVFHRLPNLREAVTLIAAAVLLLVVWELIPHVLDGGRPRLSVLDIAPGLSVAFAIEPLGMIFAGVAGTLWLVNSIYSIGYMRGNKEERQTGFYICFGIALSAAMGIAFAANLFTLFLFYEILTLSTWPLVAHKQNEEAIRGGRTYLALLLATSMILLLPAIMITWSIAGTTEFATGGILDGRVSSAGMLILLVMFMFGIGKAALIPVHFWLPAAMVAPTPVSALLHAVAVVKAGVFCVVKVIVYVFGVGALSMGTEGDWLVYAAGATVLLASIIALRQDNLKKRLAFSTVSQLSYVILAAAILTPISIIGAAMHIAAHAVSKITLFFAAGSIYTAAHLTEVSQLNGIGRRMPWTMGAFAIGAISMIGLPPTAGFLGKWFMLQGAMESAQYIPVAVIVISTLLNAAYFLPILYAAFFRAPDKGSSEHGEAPWPIVLALCLTAAATLYLFFDPSVPYGLAEQIAARSPTLAEVQP